MSGNELWSVRFAAGGLEDLVEIIKYVLNNYDIETARELSALIQTDAKKRLTTLPHRGHHVPELESISHDYREIHIKSYRIIYQPIEEERVVWILLVAHNRRSIQDMLRKRLLHYPSIRQP